MADEQERPKPTVLPAHRSSGSNGVPLEGRDSFPSYSTAHGIGHNVLKARGRSCRVTNAQLHPSKKDPSLCEDTDSKYAGLSPVSRPRDAATGQPTPELASPTSSGATTPPLISPPISAAVTPASIATVHTLKPHELDASLRIAQDSPERAADASKTVATGRPHLDTAVAVVSHSDETASSSAAASRSSSFTGGASPMTAKPSEETLVTPTATATARPAAPMATSPTPVNGRKHSSSNASTTKPPSIAGTEKRPQMGSTQERRSKFGSFFKADHGHGNRSPNPPAPIKDEESGGDSDASASSSHGGGLSGIARRLSGGAMGHKLDRKEKDEISLARQASQKDASKLERKASQSAKEASKLERKASQKREGDTASETGTSTGLAASLKELVGAGPKMTRKTSVTSRKSDEGKSEKGGSVYGGDDSKTTGTSLLKKYGVCEKVAIGKGATAVVRLAHKWDRTTERLYAVKEFRKRRKNETEREYVKKLTSEFCISSTLHHAYVVETVDLVQDEQHHWCEVMEYCPGGDLYAAIKRGNMSQAEINSYFKQILLGVTYLHSMGVAHRDIKPENLLIDAQGMVKITDFGVSDVFRMCWEKATHLSKGLCGSEPYIAPEQFDQKEYDARLVDVWAVAIVFYCLNQQELPWRSARSSDETFQAFVQAYDKSPSPPPLQALSPRECRAIVKHMLNPSTKSRWYPEMVIRDPWIQSIQIIDKHGNPVQTPASSQLPTGGPNMVTSLIHRNKTGETPAAPQRQPSTSANSPVAIKPALEPAVSPGATAASTSPSSTTTAV